MTTARSTQPHVLELEVALATVGRGGRLDVVVVVDGARVVVVAGSVVVVVGAVVGGTVVVRRRQRGRRDGCRRRGRVLCRGASRQDAEHDRRGAESARHSAAERRETFECMTAAYGQRRRSRRGPCRSRAALRPRSGTTRPTHG